MPESRTGLGPVAALGLASAGFAAVAGNQDWAAIDLGGDATDSAFASAAVSTLDVTAPPVTALALVLLATWGVVLVSRGVARRAVTWLGLLAALGVLVFAVVAWAGTPDDLAEGTESARQATRTFWSYLGVATGLSGVVASVVAVRSVRHWPEMGRRYDAPGDDGGAQRRVVPAEEQTNLDLWRAIDEGHDPTEGSTH